jgi:hypothetical protein
MCQNILIFYLNLIGQLFIIDCQIFIALLMNHMFLYPILITYHLNLET